MMNPHTIIDELDETVVEVCRGRDEHMLIVYKKDEYEEYEKNPASDNLWSAAVILGIPLHPNTSRRLGELLISAADESVETVPAHG